MSLLLRHALVCLAVLVMVGCRQQPAEPAVTPPKPAVTAPAAGTADDARARALHALEARLQSDQAYPDNCISIVSEPGDAPVPQSFEFAVRERHGNGCPGDPQTSPVRDRFRVNANGEVLWYDVVNADFVDYAKRSQGQQ
ncbi:hypothetical protein LL962_07785 [Xanthomonas sp. NCPPB 1067]|uniref:hypothetical protein n=1 Tax=Xanthomonas TaxID=338 RepID=UPI001E35E50B|nr:MULTISPECIES: hypothetical protein [Xanthomonas]MCC4587012.1 hypothetical protein [Xanthomonas sp. NCPPB 1067]MCD0277913.1 hypothetical protein [Xanthomonas melonis]